MFISYSTLIEIISNSIQSHIEVIFRRDFSHQQEIRRALEFPTSPITSDREFGYFGLAVRLLRTDTEKDVCGE